MEVARKYPAAAEVLQMPITTLVSKLACQIWLVALDKPVGDVIVVDIGIHR